MPETLKAGFVTADVAELKVIERKDDGSALVELPILVEHDEFDWSLTAGGGPQKGSISMAMMQEIVANFTRFNRPVPIGTGEHRSEERGGPSPGFIEAISIKGSTLWARISLGPFMATSVIDAKEWRGFSFEAAKNIKLPEGKYEGWVLTGGIFTNRPSVPGVHFKIAAAVDDDVVEADATFTSFRSFQPGSGKKGSEMSEKLEARLATLEAEASKKENKIEKLEGSIEELKTEREQNLSDLASERQSVATLTGDLRRAQADARDAKADLQDALDAAEKYKAELDEMKAAEQKRETEAMSASIIKTIEAALDGREIEPAFFEGHREDPVAWLKAEYGGKLATLQKVIDKFPKKAGKVVPSSGAKPADATAEMSLSEDDVQTLKGMGLDPKYLKVKTENDLEREKA